MLMMAPNVTRHAGGDFPSRSFHHKRPTSVNLCNEVERLNTFRNWPQSVTLAERLAANGFYYAGQHDSVSCAFCGIQVSGVSALNDHRSQSPQCAMVRGIPCSNVPRSYDTCGPYELPVRHFVSDFRPFSGPERGTEALVSALVGTAHRDFATEEARAQTYKDWPASCPVSVKALSEAGFFSIGQQDQVICFYCGGGLKEWQEGDNPWEEHARWFFKCLFVIQKKGQAFVDQIRHGRPAMVSTEDMEELLREPTILPNQPSTSLREPTILPNQPSTSEDVPPAVDSRPPRSYRPRAHQHRSLNLLREEDRLKTFEGWPHNFLTPRELAADGFYYTGADDNVRCTFCGVGVHGWIEGDRAHADHQKWSPKCDFVEGRPCGNIPMEDTGIDTCGSRKLETEPQEEVLSEMELLGVSKATGPSCMMYVRMEDRLKTFIKWPTDCPVKPKDLADAGYYYTGDDDEAVCFYCAGGLKRWEEGDDPWIEHARWLPKCPFLLMHKGREFVTRAKALKKSRKEVVYPTAGPSKVVEPVNVAVESEAMSSERELRDTDLCSICYASEKTIVFLPCSHLVSCPSCASAMSKCPLCRKPFQATLRVYL